MDLREVRFELKEAVNAAKSSGEQFIEIPVGAAEPVGNNQFLFFLKPELTDAGDQFDTILDFIFQQLGQFRMEVESVSVISGEYLAKFGIISDHYGIIDAAAKNPAATITNAMWSSFEEHFDRRRDEVQVIGGIPYLSGHQELDPEELSRVWLERGYFRMGSGTYCQYVADEDLYLVNGFYPRLLHHFTRPASCIVSFVLRSQTAWKIARRDFVGATAPGEAVQGSIRNGLLVRKDQLGLPEISPNLNGVHLSAGPVEGLVELMRFTVNRLEAGGSATYADFLFGRLLAAIFEEATISSIVGNAVVATPSGKESVFDLTEEMDSTEAAAALQTAVF